MNKKRLAAFTLIEILVALTIIGVLLSFVAPMVLKRPDQARQLTLNNDFMAIETALSLYQLDNSQLPSSDMDISVLFSDTATSGGYLSKQPVDPWGTPYRFAFENGVIKVHSAGKNKSFDDENGSDDVFSKGLQ